MASSTKHPLFGFIPRNVTAKQVQEVIVRGIFVPLSHPILDTVVEWQRKPIHPFATFSSVSQHSQGSKKIGSICTDGRIL